jgi:hypothetical protein
LKKDLDRARLFLIASDLLEVAGRPSVPPNPHHPRNRGGTTMEELQIVVLDCGIEAIDAAVLGTCCIQTFAFYR